MSRINDKYGRTINEKENKVASMIKNMPEFIDVSQIKPGQWKKVYDALLGLSENLEWLAFVYIIVSIISAIFIYAIGEGLQLLQQVVNNTNKNIE
mgnify:CR=1 FL=1